MKTDYKTIGFFYIFTTMYAQLGDIRFEGQKGFSSFSHERGVNYVQHERIKGKPRLQHVGDNLDTVSFDMYLHADFTNPEQDIEALNLAMENNRVMMLLLGNGKIVGNFVVPSFSQTTSFTDPFGNLISATLSVNLLEVFYEDPLRDAIQRAIADSFATQLRNSNVRTVLPAKLSNGMGLTADIGKMETSGKLVNQYIATASANTAQFDTFSDRINSTLDSIEGNISSVQNRLSEAQNLYDLAVNLPSALEAVYTRVQNLRAVMPISDINDVKILGGQLSGAISTAKTASIGISNNSIIRRV